MKRHKNFIINTKFCNEVIKKVLQKATNVKEQSAN